MANTPRRARALPQGNAQPAGAPQGQQQGNAQPQGIAQPQGAPQGQPQGNAQPQGIAQPAGAPQGQPPQRQIFLTPADANGNQFAYYFDARGNPRMVPGQQAPAAPLPGQQNQGYNAPQGQPQQVIPVQPVRRFNIWKWLIFVILFLLFAGMVTIGVITLGPRIIEGFKFAFLESDFSSVCTNSAVYAPDWDQYGRAFVANGESEDGFEYIYQNRRNGINVGNGKLVSKLPIGVEIQVWKVYEGCGAGQLPTIHSPP